MNINFKPSVEPLSTQSKGGVSRMADSQAYHIFFRELREYCRGNIGGRSVLVSGHRGSGKTTLVQKAIKNIKSSLIKEDIFDRTLLPIEIHGPSLFLDFEQLQKTNGEHEKKDGDKEDQEKVNEEPNNDDPTTNALKKITTAIYRGFSKELVNKFEIIKANSDHIDDSLIARLVLELENAATQNELGLFWRKAKRLDNIGYKELLAIASASQAYRMVIGTMVDKRESTNNVDNEQTQELNFKSEVFQSKFQPLIKELWSLLAGTAIFSGILIQDSDKGIVAAILGLLTAMLTSLTLNITSKRTRKSSYKREFSFMRDLSLNTLNREIPTLVERLKEAGYYPVFVIDELDKVLIDLTELQYFQTLIRNLKHLIADRAFFCFLTDRNYFDYLSDLFKKNPYPIEHTLFSKRLFISFNPQNLHDYLNDLFEEQISSATTEELTKIQCFIYWSLYISRFHVGDLNKNIYNNIAKFDEQQEQSSIAIPEGIANPLSSYSIQITIQLAIEYMLTHEESKLRARLEQEPHFAQIVYDTLYYPSRKWENGTRELDITQKAFRQYLVERTAMIRGKLLENQPVSTTGEETVPDKRVQEVQDDQSESTLSQLDFDFLYDQLTNLVNYLREPANLKLTLQGFIPLYDKSFNPEVWNNIINVIAEEPLITVKSNRKYSWNYDFYGRKLNPELTRTEENEMFQIAEMLFEFDDLLKKLSDGLYIFLDKYRFDSVDNPRPEIMDSIQADVPIPIESMMQTGTNDGFGELPEDILRSVINYKNTGVWYWEINNHRDRLNGYTEHFKYLFDLIGRITWLSLEAWKKYDLPHPHREPFSRQFNFYMNYLIYVEQRNIDIPFFKEVLQKRPELEEEKLSNQLNYFASSKDIDTSNFSSWKKNILDQIHQPKELTLKEREQSESKFWDIWKKRFKVAFKDGFDVQKQVYTEPLDAIYSNPNINNTFNPPLPGEDVIFELYSPSFPDGLVRRFWLETLARSCSNLGLYDPKYEPFWLTGYSLLWLGLLPGIKNLNDLFDLYHSDKNNEKQVLQKYFSNRDLKMEIDNSSDPLTIINYKVLLQDQPVKNKCVLLLSRENGLYQNEVITSFPGLLEIPANKIGSIPMDFIFNTLFKADDFEQIICYGLENSMIQRNLPQAYYEKVKYIDYVQEDPNQKKEANLNSNLSKQDDVGNGESMTESELRYYINDLLKGNLFFRDY